MIKLFSLKQQKEEDAQSAAASGKKIPAGQIRMQKDVSELSMGNVAGMEIDFYNGPEDLMNFKVHITPDDGMYLGGKFTFDCKVPATYPHDPPKVLCETTVYHPNIDMEGHVCLNILREDWKPVLTINNVMMGLLFLMLEPNADDPLNKEAAAELASDKEQFSRKVRQTFKGGSVILQGKRYDFPKFK